MKPLLFQTPDVCIWTLLNVPNLHVCCFLFHGKCVGVHGAVQLFNLIVTSNHSRLTCSMQHSLPYLSKYYQSCNWLSAGRVTSPIHDSWCINDSCMMLELVHAGKRFSTCQGGSTRNIKKPHALWPWRCIINWSIQESCTNLVHMASYTSILQSKMEV